jgi:hypothetical protein
LIVDATVEGLSTRTISRHLETDAVLRVNQSLKGDTNTSRIVVSQRGGTLGAYREIPLQDAMMQTGQRYILFLKDDFRNGLPLVETNTPRYGITRSYHGKFLVDGNQKVHVSKGAPAELREKFDGLELGQLLTEIRYRMAEAQENR